MLALRRILHDSNNYCENQLLQATMDGSLLTIETLLKGGLSLRCDYEVWGPLHFGCIKGFCDIVSLLIQAGADVNQKDNSKGKTPLMHAALFKDVDICAMLCASGSRVNIRQISGGTAVEDALSVIKDPDDEIQAFEILHLLHRYGLRTEQLNLSEVLVKFTNPRFKAHLSTLLTQDVNSQPKTLQDIARVKTREYFLTRYSNSNLIQILDRLRIQGHYRDIILGQDFRSFIAKDTYTK